MCVWRVHGVRRLCGTSSMKNMCKTFEKLNNLNQFYRLDASEWVSGLAIDCGVLKRKMWLSAQIFSFFPKELKYGNQNI